MPVAITYLHHTHPDIPHYGAESWTYTKGALATVDRSLGFIGRHLFHEIVDFHVIHHLFPTIPFYKAEEATTAARNILGSLYREQKDENFYHSFFQTFSSCKFVSSPLHGEAIFHWETAKL
jgi:omega-6 fatty acid desaturase (delta-12 desaturase)